MTQAERRNTRAKIMVSIDRRILWLLAIVVVAVVLWLVLDHVLFPTLPVPAGAPSIVK